MKIPTLPRFPDEMRALARQLSDLWKDLAQQVNGLSEGSISVRHQSLTAAPTTGTFAQGDFVNNSSPTELGAASSKYVIIGWMCTASGTPGTWVACRCLTGN